MSTKLYDEKSIESLSPLQFTRLRPGVYAGDTTYSTQLLVEIISNSIDEAREGYGDKIVVTRYLDNSIEIQDFGRGLPVDYNKKEDRYNWELVFCELYAGSKYNTNDANGSYEYSLGLNGLGLCATQYSSEYMDAEVHKDGFKYNLHFEKGEIAGEMQKEPYNKKDTGTRIRWKPDLKVFTDINIPLEYYQETIKRQSVVNQGIKFILKNQISGNNFETFEYCYENGITDYVKEHNDLDLQIRDNYINIYYKGGNILRIKSPNTFEFDEFYFYLDSRRAYKMTYIVEYSCNTRHNLYFLLVCHAAEHTQNHLRIIAGIKRLYFRFTASLVFSAFPFSFGFLDVCRVHNHNMAQVYSSFGTPNLAVETAFRQQWQVTCVVNVGVGYQHSVNFIYRNRHIIADILFPALAHTPVDKYVFAAGLEQMGRACNAVSCSYKL